MSHTGTSSLLTRKGNADNMVSAIKYESFKMLVNFFGAFTFEIARLPWIHWFVAAVPPDTERIRIETDWIIGTASAVNTTESTAQA
jgi:phosphatidylethanolamine-binding protein (PEBP) family uncharacterized protein